MNKKGIIFFTRIPTLGKTKTRLEPFIGKEKCVKLQTAFIKDIYNTISNIGIDIIVNYSDHGDLGLLKEIINEDVCFLEQQGKDLGEKMYNAISLTLERYDEIVLIGSDLPLIEKRDINSAFKILKNKDIVISPTYDGGYYLIGMKEKNQEVFNIKYSTNLVFNETIKRIKELGKSYEIGNIQLDIDDKDDFIKLYKHLRKDKETSCNNTRKLVNKIMGNYNE